MNNKELFLTFIIQLKGSGSANIENDKMGNKTNRPTQKRNPRILKWKYTHEKAEYEVNEEEFPDKRFPGRFNHVPKQGVAAGRYE